MSAGIETSQLIPRDHNGQERRRAAITCAARILQEGGSPDDLLELLRAIGLTHDPHAKIRKPLAGTTGIYEPRRPE